MTINHRAGFSLLELLIVVVILGIGMSLSIHLFNRPLDQHVSDQVSLIAQEMAAAKAEAINRGGQAMYFFDSANNWYSVLVAGHEESTTEPPAHLQTPLDDKIVFGTGSAKTGPLGDATTSGPVPYSRIVCDAWGRCGLNERPVVTYYFRAKDDGRAVAAITIGKNGTIRSWRYNSENDSWR